MFKQGRFSSLKPHGTLWLMDTVEAMAVLTEVGKGSPKEALSKISPPAQEGQFPLLWDPHITLKGEWARGCSISPI